MKDATHDIIHLIEMTLQALSIEKHIITWNNEGPTFSNIHCYRKSAKNVQT